MDGGDVAKLQAIREVALCDPDRERLDLAFPDGFDSENGAGQFKPARSAE